MLEIKVTEKVRIDKYICDNSKITRNDIKELIEQGAVSVDGVIVHKTKYIPKIDSTIHISRLLDKEIKLLAQKMPLDIVYQNDEYVIINKQNNLVVHPSPGHYENTLVNGLMYYFKNNLSNTNGLLRPGIVHRIDKDTTGLLIVAKNNNSHNLLADLIKKHEVSREYLAIVEGWFEQGILHIDLPIGRDKKNRQKMIVTNIDSKNAKTHVYVLNKFSHDDKKYSLVRCVLETGRTHQIRVHLNYIKHPVLNDPVYGSGKTDFGQYLHAYKLEFKDPFDNQIKNFFVSPPKEFDIAQFNYSQLVEK